VQSSSKTNILNDLSNGIVSEFASILDDNAEGNGISIAAPIATAGLLP
jgi:hypothetical protein